MLLWQCFAVGFQQHVCAAADLANVPLDHARVPQLHHWWPLAALQKRHATNKLVASRELWLRRTVADCLAHQVQRRDTRRYPTKGATRTVTTHASQTLKGSMKAWPTQRGTVALGCCMSHNRLVGQPCSPFVIGSTPTIKHPLVPVWGPRTSSS